MTHIIVFLIVTALGIWVMVPAKGFDESIAGFILLKSGVIGLVVSIVLWLVLQIHVPKYFLY